MSDPKLGFMCRRCPGSFPSLTELLEHDCPGKKAEPIKSAELAETTEPAEPECPLDEVEPAPRPRKYSIDEQGRRLCRCGNVVTNPKLTQCNPCRAAAVRRRRANPGSSSYERPPRPQVPPNDPDNFPRMARHAERARQEKPADEFDPEPLPATKILPTTGMPTANPSHPVRSPIRPPEWRSQARGTRRGADAMARYCSCGILLPAKLPERCENCGREVKR